MGRLLMHMTMNEEDNFYMHADWTRAMEEALQTSISFPICFEIKRHTRKNFSSPVCHNYLPPARRRRRRYNFPG
jgi:hypothetical protein